MKGLTNQPKWLVFCLGREGKKKSGYPFRLSRHAYVRARPAKSSATQATHQLGRPGVPSRGAYSLVFLPGSYSKVLFQAGHGSFTSCHIQRVFLIL